jgi:serine/threonine-protein kinase
MPDRFLGHYQIEGELGAGGMGVVFAATDSRLGRRVAIKLLHETFLSDPERLSRFEREARVLASLNHPNVATIHGLEKAGDVTFLVLEYVPGDTLADRLAKAPLVLKEALDVCRQLAEALEAAHEKGIIHRDLKPANIKITPDGKVKVLDFGLAKALEVARSPAEDGETATLSPDMTQAGVVMGTAPYMSPEQASAKPLDTRTDIWSFGCVMYEAFTGKRSFSSNSTAELLVAILDRDPDWTLLPASVPQNVGRLLRRCLAKDPRGRLRDIGDARVELEETLAGRFADTTAKTPPSGRGRILLAGIVTGLVALAGVALWITRGAIAVPPARVARFSFDLPSGSRLSPAYDVHIAFSHDSKELLYPTTFPPPRTIYSRHLDHLETQPLPGVKEFANPFYSPDGRWLAMADYQKRYLLKVPLSGGAPTPLVPVVFPFSGAWGADGYLYWTNSMVGGVVRTSQSGGKIEPVTELDLEKQERVHRFVRLLPGGRSMIYTVAAGDMDSFDDARIDVYNLDSKKPKPLVRGGTSARYSPSGHIVYARGGSLYAVRLDQSNLEVAGPTVKVLDGVLMSTSTGSAYYDISPAGDLAYAPGPVENGGRALVWVDRQGQVTRLPLPPRPYLNQRISPDGKLIAFEVEGPNHDFYVHDPARGVTTRMTADGLSHGPIWSPDGKHIAYRSWKEGMMTLYWMPADRSGPAERLNKTPGWQQPVSFSPDGQSLIFDQNNAASRSTNMWLLPMTGEREPRPISSSQFTEAAGKFSPDGKWIVYCSTESGKPEVYVQPFPGPGPKIQISSEGGMDPVWRRDGKEVFYRNGDKMMSVSVATGPPFRAGRPRMLWEEEYMFSPSSSCGIKGPSTTSYDVSPDGEHFLMTKDNDQNLYSTRIVVVLNWAEELKTLVAAAEGKRN